MTEREGVGRRGGGFPVRGRRWRHGERFEDHSELIVSMTEENDRASKGRGEGEAR